jgi:DNA-binding transcriptional MerR regulator
MSDYKDSMLHFVTQFGKNLNNDEKDSLLQPDREYSIDELARASGTTSRNIRAYQEKGILPPPKLRGRKGIYSNAHYSRLRLVSDLLERGYTLSTIADLLRALEEGLDLRAFVGVESALTSPWTDEAPVVMSIKELYAMFNDDIELSSINKVLELDLVRFEEDMEHVQIRSMRTMRAGAELVSAGIPFDALLDIIQMLRGNVERVASALVKLVSDHVLKDYDDDAIPPNEDLPALAELIWRLRPLAEMAVHAELARAMEKAANHFLGDRLETIIKNLEQKD